jgi:hypothetical protein
VFEEPRKITQSQDFYTIYILVGLGFKLSFPLAKQELYCLSHTSSPFCSGYLLGGCYFLLLQDIFELENKRVEQVLAGSGSWGEEA